MPLAKHLEIEFKSNIPKLPLYQLVVGALYERDLVSEEAIESLDAQERSILPTPTVESLELIQARGKIEAEKRKQETAPDRKSDYRNQGQDARAG